jgi:DNA polymerase
MTKVWLDDETFSPTPITNGTHRYAEKVEILIRALALDDGDILVRDLTPGGADWLLAGDDLLSAPADYVGEIDAALHSSDCEVWAHNSHFDRTVERHAGLNIDRARWRDTMVQAMAHGLPGKLAELCDVLKLPTDQAKDKAGKALIQLFCKPVPFKFRKHDALLEPKKDWQAAKAAAEAQWAGRATRETHPAEWRQFLLYAGRDIEATRAAHKKMPMWNYRDAELALWHLDQQINDRGVCIDVELAECAVNAVDAAQVVLKERTQEMTGYNPETGEGVESATKRDKLLEYLLMEYGVDLPDMQKATLERRIADPDLPEGLKELLRVRLQASTTSTSKYRTLIKGVSSDGRLRGLLQFCGASRTGRWAGRLWQPQNLPRPTLKQSVIDAGIEALKAGCADLMFENVMELTSSAIRGCVVAPPGKQLVVADLSNIEGRVLAWLAGERWKLRAFAAYDAGTGHDLYALAYAKSFGVSPESVMADKKAGGNQRQVGKVQELALGYEGGVGAFLTFAAAYNIDLEELARSAIKSIPGNVIGQAKIMLEWHRKKFKRCPAAAYGLSEQAWLMCESFKLAWRDAHPNVVQLWRDLDAAVRAAITQPGSTHEVGFLRVRKDGAWLRIILPSGRCLCYPGAALVPEKQLRGKKKAELEQALADGGEVEQDSGRTVITYMGINQYSRKWERITTYGGKLAENCLAGGTEVLTRTGWQPIEQVHSGLEVWDGEEWVSHDGCVYKGNQVVFPTYGVHMTADHLVLTTEGWKDASSCAGFDRAEVRLPGSHPLYRLGERTPIYVGGEVYLRNDEANGGIGVRETAEARHSGLLRVHAAGNDRRAQHHPWHEQPSGLCGVAQHERSVPPADAPGVPQLRRAGHRCVQALARIVRELLGRHGVDVPHRGIDRAQEQRARLQPVELPVAVAATASEQHPALAAYRNTNGQDHGGAGGTPVRDRAVDAVLAAAQRVVSGARVEPVYDLVNCGPRNRFVVRGSDGRALIVHNCTQAVARDVMAENMPECEVQGYEIVLSVHDELLTETDIDLDHDADGLAAVLATVPHWAPGLPLAAAGFEAQRYKKD